MALLYFGIPREIRHVRQLDHTIIALPTDQKSRLQKQREKNNTRNCYSNIEMSIGVDAYCICHTHPIFI